LVMSDRRVVLFCFLLGFIVRLIPEVLSYPSPIGFDTIGYAASINTGKILYHSGTFFEYPWNNFFSTWMLYLFLIPVYNLTKIDPFLLLKLAAPLIYASNVCAVYIFSRKWLTWSIKKSLLAAVIFTFQLATLRTSWDLYRHSLATIFLLLTLPLIYKANSRKSLFSFALLSLLIVFSHELIAAVLLILILGIVITGLIKHKDLKKHIKILVAALPALTIFLAITFVLLSNYGLTVEPNIINAHNPEQYHPYNLFFIVDYLKVSSPLENYPTYFSLVFDFFSLFCVLYLLWLPLAVQGFFRDKILDKWLIILLVFTVSSLLTPFFAVFQWYKWMYMMVHPITFYAANGATKLSHLSSPINTLKLSFVKSFSRLASATLLTTILLSTLFIAAPVESAVFYFGRVNSYFPSTMQYNTIPLQDQSDLIECLKWFDMKDSANTSILLHHSLLSWARLYLPENFTRIYYISNIEEALNLAMKKEFDYIYLVWYNTDRGWYNISVPDSFQINFQSGRFAAFKY
jgi:hypothetical protein